MAAGLRLCLFTSVTLLKPADAAYLLPLEKKLDMYLSRALRWTLFSQMGLPLIFLIVALPLLSATGAGSKMTFIWLAIFIVVMKWMFVEIEYYVRHALSGEKVWLDRAVRFLLATLLLYIWLSPYPLFVVVIAIAIGVYGTYWRKEKDKKPFPYNHFIELEQNRMMRFYRFANYFTDVPHLTGSVSRRAWLGFLQVPQNWVNLIHRRFYSADIILRMIRFGCGCD